MSSDPITAVTGNASLDPLSDGSVFSLFGVQTLSQILASMLTSQNAAITQLRDSRSALNTIRGTFSQVGSLVGSLRNEVATLALPATSSRSVFRQTGFTSSDSTKVRAASSTTAATPGTYYVNVYQVAQPHTLLSEDFNATGNDLMNFLARGTYKFRTSVTGEAGTTVTSDETADITFVIGTASEVVTAAGGTKTNVDNEYGLVISEGGSIPTDSTFLNALATAFNRSTLGPTAQTTIATGTPGKGRLQATVAGGVLSIQNTIPTGNRISLSELQHDLLTSIPQSATSQANSGSSTFVSSVGTVKLSSTSNIASNALLVKPFSTTVAGTSNTSSFVPTDTNSTILSQLRTSYDSIGSVTDPAQPININAYLDTNNRFVIANGSRDDISISDPDGLLASIFSPLAFPLTLSTTVTPASTSSITTGDTTTKIAGVLNGTYTFTASASDTGSATLSLGQTNNTILNNLVTAINGNLTGLTATRTGARLDVTNGTGGALTITGANTLFNGLNLSTSIADGAAVSSTDFRDTADTDIVGKLQRITHTVTLTQTNTTPSVALTIGESNDTVLGKIRDAINGKFKNLSASVAGGRLTITNNDLSTITFAAFNPSNLFTSIGLATSVTAGNSINSSTFDTGAAGTDTTDIVGKLRGTYTFDITLGATTETVSVTINTGQTNTTVLNNIRNAINAAGIPDVTASVAAGVLTIDNASTDTLTLTQTSAGTAGTNLFSAIGLATTVGRSSSANSSTFTGTERDIAGTINPTTYTFTIGETTTGNVTVTTGQTNDTVLSNIAAALNNKFRDLTASVAGGQLTITNTDLNNVTLANATNLLNASGIGLTSATVTSGGGTVTSATFDTGSGAGTTDLAGKVDPATYNFTLTSTDTTGTVTVSPTQVNSVVLTNIENATNGILTGLTASGGATGTLTVTNGTGGTLTFTQTSGAGNLFTETGISTPLLPGSSDTSSPTHSDPAGTTLAGSIGPSTETITISGTNNPETGADFTATLSGISITSGRTNGQLLQDVRNAINGNTTLNAREVSAKNTATSTVAITNGTGASITVTDSGNDLLQKLGFGTGGTSMTITSTAGTNHIVSSKISDATNTITLDSSILDKFRYRITGSLGGTAEVIIGATDSDVTILTNIRDAINSAGAGNPRITINGPISTVTATLTTDNRLRITSSSIVTISDADSAGDPSTDTSVDNLIRVLNFDVPAANSTSLVGRIDSNAFTGTTRVPTLASGTYSFSLTLNNSDTSTTGDTRTVTGTVSVATTDDTNEEVLTRVANAINSAVSTINTADRVTASLPTESTGLRRLIITSNTTGPSSMIFGLTDTTTISASTANTQKFLTSTTTPTTSTHTSMTAGRYLINSLSGTVGKSAINQATYSASEGVILLPLDIKQTSGSSGYTRRGNELYAVFSLNGTVLFREKNEVSDAITGATFELKNSTLNTTQQTTFLNNLNPTSTTTTISPTPSGITTASVQLVIGQSSTDVRASIGKFIDSYNALVQFLIDNQKLDTSDPGNPVRGKLSSDVAYSNLQRRLTEIVFSTVTPLKTYTDNGQLTGGLSGDPSRLQDIGITVDEAGKLQLSTASRIVTPARIKDGKVETTSDSAVFDSKLSSNLAGVTHLFNFNGKDQNGNTITGATKGIAVQMKELLDGFARTGGIVSLSKRGLNLRIGNVDDQIGFVLRLISTRQDLILEELEKLQIALNLVSAQKAFTQSFFLVGFFQSAILGTST